MVDFRSLTRMAILRVIFSSEAYQNCMPLILAIRTSLFSWKLLIVLLEFLNFVFILQLYFNHLDKILSHLLGPGNSREISTHFACAQH